MGNNDKRKNRGDQDGDRFVSFCSTDPDVSKDYDETEQTVFGKDIPSYVIFDENGGYPVAFVHCKKLAETICNLMNDACVLECQDGELILDYLPGYDTKAD